MKQGKMAESLGGLARDIRTCGESNDLRDPFDLARYDEARCSELVRDAFSEPIPARAALRFSFLVGGGKAMRQKYDPNCGKYMATALRALGFEEDRGASEDLSCQGKFKNQHDTDKNIMTLHIFPHVRIQEDEAQEPGAIDWKNLPPEYLTTVCSLPVFKGLVKAKTPSWTQRKRLLDALRTMGQKFQVRSAIAHKHTRRGCHHEVLVTPATADYRAEDDEYGADGPGRGEVVRIIFHGQSGGEGRVASGGYEGHG